MAAERNLTVTVLSDADVPGWNQFVADSQSASCYHQLGWKRVIEKSFGHTTRYLVAKDGDAVAGVLPLVHLKSRLFGSFLVSLPFFNYGGVCARDAGTAERLIEEAARVALQLGARHVELRHSSNILPDLPQRTDKVAMHLDLPADAADLMRAFPSKLRSQIRKPQKEGFVTRIGREDELRNFYAVFSRNMRDLGTPVYDMSFFQNVLSAFPSSSWICSVLTPAGKPVASGLLVGCKDTMEIPWASSLRSYNSQGPNMMLYWRVLQFCCEQGFTRFDFGRSTRGEGTYRFKEQWGAKPVQLHWHYLLQQGVEIPQLNPGNPRFRFLINMWQRLPVPLACLIGPHVVKNLP